MSKNTIVLTGGGTAGHITPLLAVARKILLKDPSCKLVLILERGNPNEQLIWDSGVPLKIHRIFAGKFRRFHNQSLRTRLLSLRINLLNLRDVLFTIFGTLESIVLMIRYRPRAVFSKGSYASVPVCLAAILFLRKIITHDSDSVPGLANRITAKFARFNAVGSNGSSYPYKKEKIVYTGVPVSDEYLKRSSQTPEKLKAEIYLPKNSLILLVGGSTQGSRVIDDAVEAVVPKLLRDFPNLYVVHVLGRLNQDTMEQRYKSLKEDVEDRLILKNFLNDQYKYAAAADVVVTRAGATALAEYGVLGKACIVVPAEQLTGGHQLNNSKLLEAEGAIEVVRETEAGKGLSLKIEYLLQHQDMRTKLGEKLRSITPNDAADDLASLILKES